MQVPVQNSSLRHLKVCGIPEMSKQSTRTIIAATRTIRVLHVVSWQCKTTPRNGIQLMHIHWYVIILYLLFLSKNMFPSSLNISIIHIYVKQNFAHFVFGFLLHRCFSMSHILVYLHRRFFSESIRNISMIKLKLI